MSKIVDVVVDVLKNYIRYRKMRQQIAKVYFSKLFKATLLLSIVPFMAIGVLVVFGRLTLGEGIFGIIVVFYGSTFFAKPYLADLSSLTNYVEQLALDRKPSAPLLSFLSNVEELSQAVKNLHTSWGDRKIKLEAAIAESAILFDTLPDILLMVNSKMQVVRANKAALSQFGADIIGHTLEKHMPDPFMIDSIKSVMNLGESQSHEMTLIRHDIDYDYKVILTKFPVHSPGDIAVVIVMHDITDVKRIKQMTKDFVANASHEIRTPLTSLVGFIETLRTIGKNDPEAQEKFLAIMAEQADHMTNLVNDLLSLSKIEVKENSPLSEEVSIHEVLDSAIGHFAVTSAQKNMTFEVHKQEELPNVLGDTRELVQVLSNLISNALRYGKEGSTITITAVKADFYNEELQSNTLGTPVVYVSVFNEGEGLAPENISRITERFYRVDKVRTRKLGGSGLGLAIVKHILNRHRSDLLVQSDGLGKGCTFTVCLPIPNKKELEFAKKLRNEA